MGAKVSGAGTDVIKVRGVAAACTAAATTIIPDQIEAGTYMAAAAAAGGDVLVENVIPKHLDCITAKLREMGARITEYDDAIRVQPRRPPAPGQRQDACPIPASRPTCSRRSPCAWRWPRARASSPRASTTTASATRARAQPHGREPSRSRARPRSSTAWTQLHGCDGARVRPARGRGDGHRRRCAAEGTTTIEDVALHRARLRRHHRQIRCHRRAKSAASRPLKEILRGAPG